MTAFWDIAACSLVEVGRRFRGAYYLHNLIALMMDGVAYAPLKRQSTSTRLHAAISQAVIFNFIWMQKYLPYYTMFI
jgi:hypothetical protein